MLSRAEGAPAWLSDVQARGRAVWDKTPMPTRRTEAWKYNNLKPLQTTFSAATGPASVSLPAASYPELAGTTLVFIDGLYREDLSQVSLPEGARLVRFADADAPDSTAILERLGTAVNHDRHLFAPLNDATLADGVQVTIDKGVVVGDPIQVIWATSGEFENVGVTQRLLFEMSPNSQATLVETFVNLGSAAAFTNGISELLLQDNAQLNHYRLHLEEEEGLHVGGVHAVLGSHATLNSFHLALGSLLKRIDVTVQHEGEGAHCEINGIYLPRGDEQIDYHTCIEHAVPHCTSSETFRGIVADSSRAVFNGRIHIHPDAQKTFAELSNKNLLTSHKAEVYTKPELEIYADDVQCAHGATVAQMDATALHYLRTRGVPAAEAEVMLSYGFINEVVETVRCDGVRDFLKPLLAHRFARNPNLTRHIL
ncbi:FeS assembly protein SufD [Luminiphilus syltensis NOR5-1B]|uniref:FeS assembly protein SufD n=2 Tax=Luminiphilus TaxID=1341118 RepID=B8KQU3_9GAMM|nr:FeS assembly protein SufD [Luminiphilus syltensis NOR5-1B]